MYPIPGSDQRMDEFKYLAFLSFTARHFKKWSKKSKVIFFTVIFVIIAATIFWVFWSFVAENPAVTVLPSGNNANTWFSSEIEKDDTLVKQLLENRDIKAFCSIGNTFSGNAVKLVLHTNGTVNKEELAKNVAEKILQSASEGGSEITIKPLRFANGTVICYSSIIQTKGNVRKVKLVFTEIPGKGSGTAGSTYYCGALVMPTGLFARAEVKANVAFPVTVRKKFLSSNNVGLATLFEAHPTYADNTIYLYDVQEITVKGTGMDVFYAQGAVEQDFLSNLLYSAPQKVVFP